jgi:hypothetical protein
MFGVLFLVLFVFVAAASESDACLPLIIVEPPNPAPICYPADEVSNCCFSFFFGLMDPVLFSSLPEKKNKWQKM